MDIELARTFLAIVEAGSFVRAAERVNVTQTTVSTRVRSLEDQLRRPVFIRNKAGVTLTSAGEQFLRFAPTLVQVWERARHQVAVPEGRRAVLAVGGELTFWNPLLLNWMVWMRHNAPDIALQTQVGLSDGLLRQVADGVLDLAVVGRITLVFSARDEKHNDAVALRRFILQGLPSRETARVQGKRLNSQHNSFVTWADRSYVSPLRDGIMIGILSHFRLPTPPALEQRSDLENSLPTDEGRCRQGPSVPPPLHPSR